MALKRIQKELKQLQTNPVLSCTVAQVGNDMFEWKAIFNIPQESKFGAIAGHKSVLNISLGKNYPFKAPTIKFTPRIYHKYVDHEGTITLSILKDTWAPSITISSILSVIWTDILSTKPQLTAPSVQEYKQKISLQAIPTSINYLTTGFARKYNIPNDIVSIFLLFYYIKVIEEFVISSWGAHAIGIDTNDKKCLLINQTSNGVQNGWGSIQIDPLIKIKHIWKFKIVKASYYGVVIGIDEELRAESLHNSTPLYYFGELFTSIQSDKAFHSDDCGIMTLDFTSTSSTYGILGFSSYRCGPYPYFSIPKDKRYRMAVNLGGGGFDDNDQAVLLQGYEQIELQDLEKQNIL